MVSSPGPAVASSPPPRTIRPTTEPGVEHAELRGLLSALRRELWWRRALVTVLVACAAGALGAALLLWFGQPIAALAVIVLALAGGALVGWLRPPAATSAARRADREFDLSNRLGTASEILAGRINGPLSKRQLADSWTASHALTPGRVFASGNALLFGAGSGAVLSLAVLSLVVIARPSSPVPEVIAEVAAIEAVPEPTPAPPPPVADVQNDPPLRTPAAEAALAHLSDALRPTTAAHDIAESLQRGDTDQAADRLRDLATNSDQLSLNARRELARALDNAGRATLPLSQPLAQAEQDAGVALQRMQYDPERAALEQLAERVQQTGNNTLPPELAKSMQSSAADPGEQKYGAQQGGGEEDPNAPVGNEKGIRPGQETIQSSNGKGDDVIASAVNTRSRVGRISAGLEVGGNPVGDPTNPLAVSGVPLPLDNNFADDRGRGPAKPDAPVVKITDSPEAGVEQPGVDQVSEPVQIASEQTRESPSRRQVVRTFFDPRDRGPR